MPDSVKANFTITRDEYVRAIRRYYKTELQLKRDLPGSIIAIVAGVWVLQSTSTPAFAWMLIVLGGGVFVLVVYTTTYLPQVIYRSQPKLKSEYRLEFRDDGIGFHTDEMASELKWSIYHSWRRDDEFYILHYGKRDISVIPRRALLNRADDQLAALLRQHIGPPLA